MFILKPFKQRSKSKCKPACIPKLKSNTKTRFRTKDMYPVKSLKRIHNPNGCRLLKHFPPLPDAKIFPLAMQYIVMVLKTHSLQRENKKETQISSISIVHEEPRKHSSF